MKTKLTILLVCIAALFGCVWPGIDNRKQGPWDHRDIKTPANDVHAFDSAKQQVRDALIERDKHIMDLEAFGKKLVADFGQDVAYLAVVSVWNELTGDAPLAHASDVLWLQERGAHVQSVAWLIQFKDQWSN